MLKALKISLKAVFAIVLAVVLLSVGMLMGLYSKWGQEKLIDTFLDKINENPALSVSIDSLRLGFPLKLNVLGVSFVEHGDTMVKADTLRAKVRLLPLIAGTVDIPDARLSGAMYRMGSPDSAMYLVLKARDIHLNPATVKLSTMDINIDEGTLRGAMVDMTIKPDTMPKAATDTTATSPMRISLKKLHVEDLTYIMHMLPTIDSLGTYITRGTLTDGVIDLGKQQVRMHSFSADRLSADYIAPDAETIAATPVPPPDTVPSAPWTISIDTISLTNSRALYTTRGVEPLPGLDFGYIQADSMDLTITDFYNQATTLSMPLRLHATERCGLTLDATGTYAMDSAAMYFQDFHVITPLTDLSADGMMGVGDLMTDPWLPLALKVGGHLGLQDMALMFPDYQPYLKLLPRGASLDVNLDLSGTAGSFKVQDLILGVARTATIRGKGWIQNPFKPSKLAGDISLSGRIIDVKSIVRALTTPDLGLIVPPMTLDGHVKMRAGDIDGNLKAVILGGRIALDGQLKGNTEGYKIDLTTDQFPLHAFMPDLGVGNITMALRANGAGFDITKDTAELEASGEISSVVYNGYEYRGISLVADIHEGIAGIEAGINNLDLTVRLMAHGNLTGDTYEWEARADGDIPDMMALKLSETPMALIVNLDAEATYTPATNDISASIFMPELNYKGGDDNEFTITNVTAKVHTNDSLTTLSVHNRDLNATASMPMGYADIGAAMDSVMAVMDSQIAARKVEVDTLQRVLPKFNIDVTAGSDNLINDILRPQQMSIAHLTLNARNDTVLSLRSDVLNYTTQTMRLDTIAMSIAQDGNRMHIIASIDNRPGNMDNFAHVRVDGLLNTDRLSMRVNQQNAAMETGYDLGAIAAFADSTVTARLFPLNPVIGYKKWTVNLDNYLKYNFFTHNLDANLKMKGDDSSLLLYTDHTHQKSLAAVGENTTTDGQGEDTPHSQSEDNDSINNINNIILEIKDVHLSDWISFNPFAPPISGNLSAQMSVQWDGATNINGQGNVTLDKFYYDRKRVADMVLDLDVNTNLSGTVRANADLSLDGTRTMSLTGVLNDSTRTSPFNLDLSVIEFPLATANPFLPEDVAQLSGMLNGRMEVSGDSDRPLINGEIDFEHAYVRMAMTNTSYKFSDVKIPVKDNVITFTDFSIAGANENPLYINGKIDLRSMTDPRLDLALKAKNMMVVNTQKASRNALIYGKGYLNLDAKVEGNMNYMSVDASVNVLSGTNLTYVLTESPTDVIAATNEDMVKFINLNDTAAVAAADSLTIENMLMRINAQLNIETGTTVTVNLPTGARDRVQLQPSGYLTYTQAPMSDGRLTGRININSGMARYTLPVIGSEKTFTFDQDSYVVFNGDILNPVLNIHADDIVKTNVTQQGQNSRMVTFDIKLGVTGTLEQMNVAFDLSTDDDLSIANELQGMSAEQRANQAMNMLLYNMYTGPGTSNNLQLSTGPLFSFLESQINNWAANNIKGVDLSFGIDQYNQTTNGATTSAMNYSYQVSKTLFNDRFKIVVGGNYTTDNNADENIAENLINDISFEYYLNSQQTMLLRLFRHVGYVSVLEGEVTQTGVGFVYRRKLNRLAGMLPKFMRPRPRRINSH